MFDWITNVPPFFEFVILLAGFIAAVLAIYKTVVKPARKFLKRWDSAMDTLVGYPAVLDPGTGKELQPPTPPMAQRVATLEDAMTKLLDLQERQMGFNERLLELELWRKEHMQWSEGTVREIQEANIAWQKEHETMHLLAHETAVQTARELPPPPVEGV